MALGDRQEIVWGGGYRSDTSGAPPGFAVTFAPSFKTAALSNVFLQDEIRLTNGLWFTVGLPNWNITFTQGSKSEPSARLVWAPRPAGIPSGPPPRLKPSASRAGRTTSPQSILQALPLGGGSARLFPRDRQSRGHGRKNSGITEIGYRSGLTRTLSFRSRDVSEFLIITWKRSCLKRPLFLPGPPTVIEIPLLFENSGHAETYGGEVSLTWKAASRWRISPGYSYLHARIRQGSQLARLRPRRRCPSDFPREHGPNSLPLQPVTKHGVRSIGSITRPACLGGSIPGHARLDARLARRIGESMEISLVGQNLLRPRTLEYGDSSGVLGTEAVRSVYAKIAWRF